MPMYLPPFEERVRQAINHELEDAAEYNELATLAPNDELRAIIMSIAGDEYGHARIFSGILSIQMGMTVPGMGPSQADMEQFMEGLREGVIGELEAISEYALLARDAPNDEIRAIIMTIIADEFAHARIFLSILATMMMNQGTRPSWGPGLG
jgi:rubrerythrin